ncbi:MAG: FHA domain-containing protein [Candidatus Calescibacterium sp.]|nr:FHA domain-containing protein [Candidatus Calescibacterium sp.]MDW8132034.1 FHA domain-containing protein [Candidatus Calescibacterium sp.]
MFVKICPSCGQSNKANEILCVSCMIDISGVRPIDNSKIDSDVDNKADSNVESNDDAKLFFREKVSGRVIELSNADIIGRYNKGSEIFLNLSNPKIISRIHCQVFYRGGKWYIKDLNSTNNTFLNGVKLSPNEDYELNNKDIVSLSGIIDFVVEFK